MLSFHELFMQGSFSSGQVTNQLDSSKDGAHARDIAQGPAGQDGSGPPQACQEFVTGNGGGSWASASGPFTARAARRRRARCFNIAAYRIISRTA
jgi:hypothetical protein